jgi:hypothetical protein
MRILYDFGFYHELTFYETKEKQSNKALKEIMNYLHDVTLENLKPPVKKFDKIFLEGLPENKKYTTESLIKDASWVSSIKKLHEKYNSELVGLEKPSYYTTAFYAMYLSTYSKNKFLSKMSKKIDDVFNNVRTYHFAKVINKELKEGEIGIALHGKAHEITNYLNRIAPDIEVYPVENELATFVVKLLFTPMKPF